METLAFQDVYQPYYAGRDAEDEPDHDERAVAVRRVPRRGEPGTTVQPEPKRARHVTPKATPNA